MPVRALDVELCLERICTDIRFGHGLGAPDEGALREGNQGFIGLEAVVLPTHTLHVHDNVHLSLIPGQRLIVVVREDRRGDGTEPHVDA